MRRRLKTRLAVGSAAIVVLTFLRAHACTVFIITDGDQALFCHNEDFSNPNTRIWFIPGSANKHGCEFVGFDDGWGQGGLNEKGLAFGWVAGYEERWQRRPELKDVRGNSCQRMLESCQTVEEAVAFYRANWEESFLIELIHLVLVFCLLGSFVSSSYTLSSATATPPLRLRGIFCRHAGVNTSSLGNKESNR